jgi:transketolase
MLGRAYQTFLKTTDCPTLIVVDSHIGYGSPNKQDTSDAHGEPLGEAEVKLVKRNYGWPEDAKFYVPDGVYDHFKNGIGKRGAEARSTWNAKFDEYKKQFPQLADQLQRIQTFQLPEGWDKDLPAFPADAKGMATRESSGKVLNAIAKNIPWLLGGSADLAHSNKTNLTFEGAGDFYANEYRGRNLHFGVREHAMGAAVNGLSVSRLRAYGATFFNFSDYMKGSMRLAALMGIPSIFLFTHDSIGLGEDGPTHQPVEQLAHLRAAPNLYVVRPADANETALAWRFALQQTTTPTALALSRQGLPVWRPTAIPDDAIERGAYVLRESYKGDEPDLILIATGSEVHLCNTAADLLEAGGVATRLVSMPCMERFAEQETAYRDKVLPPACHARVAVEAASPQPWYRWVGDYGGTVAMESFGASGPAKAVFERFGFTAARVAQAGRSAVERASS